MMPTKQTDTMRALTLVLFAGCTMDGCLALSDEIVVEPIDVDAGFAETATSPWVDTFGPTQVHAMARDVDEAIIIGGRFDNIGSGPASVLKLSKAGELLWTLTFGSVAREVKAVAVDEEDGIYIAGEFSSPLVFGEQEYDPDGTDVFVAKISATGEPLWLKVFSTERPDRVNALALAENGDVIVAANTTALLLTRLTRDGDEVWTKRHGNFSSFKGGADALAVDAESVFVTGHIGNTVNVGGSALPNEGGGDIFLARYRSDTGEHDWSQSFGGPLTGTGVSDNGRAVRIVDDGAVLLGGQFRSSADFGGGVLESLDDRDDVFVALFSQDGTHLSSSVLNAPGDDSVRHLGVAGDDWFLVTQGGAVMRIAPHTTELSVLPALPGEGLSYTAFESRPDGRLTVGMAVRWEGTWDGIIYGAGQQDGVLVGEVDLFD